MKISMKTTIFCVIFFVTLLTFYWVQLSHQQGDRCDWNVYQAAIQSFKLHNNTYISDNLQPYLKGECANLKYFYPPLFLLLSEACDSLQMWHGEIIAWLGLLFLFVLIPGSLAKYRFSSSIYIPLLIFSVGLNVPLYVTVFNLQINTWVLGFILSCGLLYDRSCFLSALCLAIACQLKGLHFLVYVAFLIPFDRRFIFYSIMSHLLLLGIVFLRNGMETILWYANFLLYSAKVPALSWTNISIDVLIINGIKTLVLSDNTIVLISTIKLFLFCLICYYFYRIRSSASIWERIALALPLNLFFSPISWVHHYLFALPLLWLSIFVFIDKYYYDSKRKIKMFFLSPRSALKSIMICSLAAFVFVSINLLPRIWGSPLNSIRLLSLIVLWFFTAHYLASKGASAAPIVSYDVDLHNKKP